MEEIKSIPVTFSFSGVATYLVETKSYEEAALIAEKCLRLEHPRVHIDAILVLDPAELDSILESGQKVHEIKIEGF